VSIRDLYCRVVGIFNVVPAACSTSAAGVYSENFDTLDAWNFTRGNTWELADGMLCTNRGGEHRGFSGDSTWDDYTINVDTAEMYRGNGYGVYFRVSDEPDIDGYTFQFDPAYRGGHYPDGAFLIRKVVNGQETPPIAAEPAPPGFEWNDVSHQVTIQVEGDTYTASVDGEQVIQAVDDEFQTGRFGLRTWDSTSACFDNITVTQP
jgi:hypothetical protein